MTLTPEQQRRMEDAMATSQRSAALKDSFVETERLAKNLAVDRVHGIFERNIGKHTDYISFEDVRWAKVKVDSKTVQEGGLGAVVGRALIGGVIAGGIGAVVGGATTQKRVLENVRSVSLELGIPGYEDCSSFLLYDKLALLRRFTPERAQEVAHEIVDLIDSARSARVSQAAPTIAPVGLAGEIQKLNELRQQGVLSEQEFVAAKAKLFGTR